MFTWIWQDAGRDWAFFESNVFADDHHWVKYAPFFWRSGTEFFAWEAAFVEFATRKRPVMNQKEFEMQGRKLKRDLNLGAIQAAVTGAATKGPWLWKAATMAIDKVNDVDGAIDMAKCWIQPDEYEKECAKVVAGWIMKGAKIHISE